MGRVLRRHRQDTILLIEQGDLHSIAALEIRGVMTAKSVTDIAAMSFEQALKELEGIVRKLESGQGELEGAIADYERGTALKDHCQGKLASAKMKVEKIMQSADGTLTAVPLDREKQ
jgi:exodeoxyribonuclease VII small subunit